MHFPESEFSSVKNLEFIEDSLKDKEIQIIYEDEYILVLNKPHNLTVHDAPSVKDATLVDWLKLQNISLSTLSGEKDMVLYIDLIKVQVVLWLLQKQMKHILNYLNNLKINQWEDIILQ